MEKQFLIEDRYSGNIYYFMGVSQVSGNRRSTVTQYPTASGKKISDNVFVEPQNLSFSLLTSRLAMTPQKILRAGSSELTELTVQDIKEVITDWQFNANRLNITSFEGYYPNMVLSGIQVQEGESLGLWQPTLTFTEVREATVEITKLQFPKDAQEQADGNDEQALGADNGWSASDYGSVIGAGAVGLLGGVGVGIAIGTAIGTVVPGPGNVIGAVIGGIVGLATGLFAGWKK